MSKQLRLASRKLNYAGGYRPTAGCSKYPHLSRGRRKPWIAATRALVRAKLKAGEYTTRSMMHLAQAYLGSCVASSPNLAGCGKVGAPRVRAATILAHILKQGKYNAHDIMVHALAVKIQCKHDGDVAQPIPSDYFRSVQVGRAVHALLKMDKPVLRVYDDGHGNYGERAVKYPRLKLSSRYVAQQLERLTIVECGGNDFVRKEAEAVAGLVNQATARRYARLNAKEALRYSRSVQRPTA